MKTPPTPRIKILQYMHGDFTYFFWSEKINQAYCERHGYEYVIRRAPTRTDRHVNWQKIPDMIAELHGCDFLLALDADAFFYGQELTVEEELIPLLGEKLVLMSQDIGSESERWNPGLPCVGAILMRNNDLVRRLLRDWDDSSSLEERFRWQWPLEQTAFWQIVLPRYEDHVKVEADYYRIHARYGQYIRHCMGQGDTERSEIMKRYWNIYLQPRKENL